MAENYSIKKRIIIMLGIVKRFLNLLGSTYRCNICGKSFFRFRPFIYANIPHTEVFKLNNSEVKKYRCMYCNNGSGVRNKYEFMKNKGFFENFKDSDVLHFAPENGLKAIIDECDTKSYVCADLYNYNSKDIVKLDITDISFPDKSFDYIICSHVLGHIPDDVQAMKELYRVLREGGKALVPVPFSHILNHTFEDDGVNTDELRLQVYGQGDHVRIYGLDYFSRLESVGFSVERIAPCEYMTEDFAYKHAIKFNEEMVLVTK